jgi:colanic acid/amylovoran biosynthesis protein
LPKLCFLGAALDTGNMGVSALSASIITLSLETFPDSKFYFLIGNRSNSEQIVKVGNKIIIIDILNIRLSAKSEIKSHFMWLLAAAFLYRIIPFNVVKKWIADNNYRIKKLLECDFIGDIRGGDSFSDIYGLRKFLQGCIPISIVILLGKKFVLLPQTFGPYKSSAAKIMAKFILKSSSLNLTRDSEGLEVLSSLSGGKIKNSTKHSVCPDVAFALGTQKPKNYTIYPDKKLNDLRPFIGLNVNGLMFNGGYNKKNMFDLNLNYKSFILDLCCVVMKNTGSNILLLPHTYRPRNDIESDEDACNYIFDMLTVKYSNRIFRLDGRYNQSELKWIIGKCDLFVGSRMHSCIAGLSQGIPTIGIAYSRKFLGVFKSVKAQDCVIDARIETSESGIHKFLTIYNNRKIIEMNLKAEADKINRQLRVTFHKILNENNTSS